MSVNADSARDEQVLARARGHYNNMLQSVYKRTDRLFAGLMVFQWLAAIAAAIFISPYTWVGTVNTIHVHIWAALVLGGAITFLPVVLTFTEPGMPLTRHVIAAAQMLMSALLIHLSGGRIETHFHVFGSLAFLAFYRDWKVLVTASTIVAMDHFFRGLFWPQSVYGILTVQPWRWLEHTGWVLFEDAFLILSIKQSRAEMWNLSQRQAQLEFTNSRIEAKVIERTAELQKEVHQRKLTEAALQKSHDDALLASQYKSEFLANMSHEIRTPLNGVIGMGELMMHTPLTDEQREYGAIINKSAYALLSLINDILDYSKIEAGKLELEIINFDIVELVEGAADLVRENAAAKNLALAAYIDPNLPRILKGDPGRIRQVLLNFLSNGVKFTESGEIIIRAVADASEGKNVKVRFSVSDTGIGLSEPSRERLFEPFTQADASITRRYGGTGLGLAICKRLVGLMGGEIECDSKYGEGSVFTFAIDLQTGDYEIPTLKPPAELDDLRVLLINGPPGIQQVLNSYISAWGFRCSWASDIDKAIVMLKKEAAGKDAFKIAIIAGDQQDSHVQQLVLEKNNNPQLSETRLVFLKIPIKQSKLLDCIASLMSKGQDNCVAPDGQQMDESAGLLSVPEARNLVLVVEDNPANQKVALLQLRELGLSAHAVGNGIEAVEAAARTQYSIILMDCQMPEMDGLEATREIRKMETRTGRHSPIIAMTAHAMHSDRVKCIAAGMDDYIAKPVSQQQLAAVLARWLPKTQGLRTPPNAEPSFEIDSTKPIEVEILRTTFGDKTTDELMKQLHNDVGKHVSQLQSAAEEKDIVTIKKIVHDLKSEAATLYATELADLSRQLENTAAEEELNWSKLRDDLQALSQAAHRLRMFLHENVESLADSPERD